MENKLVFHPHHAKRLLQNLQATRNNAAFCDGTVIVCGERIPVQRNVLAAASDYFRALYHYDNDLHAEPHTTDNHGREVILDFPGISADTFRMILDYIYMVDINIHVENIDTLLCAADVLLMADLKELCCDFLEEQICMENCLTILNLAEMFSCARIVNVAYKFIDAKFRDVIRQKEFLELPFVQLRKLLSRRSLNVRDEEVIAASVMNWVEHAPDDRVQLIHSLFYDRVVRLSQPAASDVNYTDALVSQMQKYGRTKEDVDRFKSYLEGSYYTMNSDSSLAPRGYIDVLVACGGHDVVTNEIKRSCYFSILPPENTYEACYVEWQPMGNMNLPRAAHGLTEAGGYLYAAGGLVGMNDDTDTVERYDPATNTWTFVSAMSVKRFSFGLHSTAAGDKLYCVSGSTFSEDKQSLPPQSITEEYDVFNDSWRRMADIGTPRSSAATAITPHGHVYVMGGGRGNKLVESVEVFDPRLNSWTSVAPMNERRYGGYADVSQDSVFVIGGKRNHGCPSMAHAGQRFCNSEVYNLSTRPGDEALKVWKCLPRDNQLCLMTDSSDVHGVVAWRDQLLVAGTLDQGGVSHCVRAYMTDRYMWRGVVLNQPPLTTRYNVAVLRMSFTDLYKIIH